MKPETWYRIYWTAMGLAFLVVNTIAVRWAVKSAIVAAARQLGWTE